MASNASLGEVSFECTPGLLAWPPHFPDCSSLPHLPEFFPEERAPAGYLHAEKFGDLLAKLADLFQTLQPVSLTVQELAQQFLYLALSLPSFSRQQFPWNGHGVDLMDIHQRCKALAEKVALA